MSKQQTNILWAFGLAVLLGCLSVAGAAPLAKKTQEGAGTANGDSRVTMPLSEYQQLLGRPSVTVVDLLRVEGSFETSDLSIWASGRTAGNGPTVEALATLSGARLWGCEGEAVLSRGDSDKYELTPLGPKFSLRCRVALKTGDRLQFVTSPHVLWIESAVKDGEMIRNDEEGGKQRVTIVHLTKDPEKALPVSAIGRYHIRFSSEGTKFVYTLLLRNPNRSSAPFHVMTRNSERVQQLESAIGCEPQKSDFHCQVPPGEHTLTMHGSLPGTTFNPPVQAAVHHLLLDSHPLLRPIPESVAPHISVSETGMSPQFRGAQAFLLSDGQTFSWRLLRLEALHTQMYAVNRALSTFFLGRDGQVLGETTLDLDNQGAAELLIPKFAEPTYASIGNEPMLLTKNEVGALLLPLLQGSQQVGLQYRQTFSPSLGFGFVTLLLPELATPAANAHVELRYDRDWLPLYEELSPDMRFPTVSIAGLLLLVAVFFGAERLLHALGLLSKIRLFVAGCFCLAAAGSSSFLAVLVLAELLCVGLFALPWLFGKTKLFWLITGGLCLGGLWALLLGVVLVASRPAERSMPVSSTVAYSRNDLKEASDEEPKKEKTKAPTYQGLPPKETLPFGDHHSYLHRERLSNSQRTLHLVMIRKPTIQVVATGGFALGLVFLLVWFAPVRAGLSVRWRKILDAKAASDTA